MLRMSNSALGVSVDAPSRAETRSVSRLWLTVRGLILRRVVWSIAVGLSLAASSGCGSSAAPKPQPSASSSASPHAIPSPTTARPGRLDLSASIQGSVTDSRDHSPIAGALIIVGGAVTQTKTNSYGRFRVAFPANRATPVTVTAVGYGGGLAEGTLRKGQSATVDFRLVAALSGQPPPPSRPITFGQP
jgi:hypothetical protein